MALRDWHALSLARRGRLVHVRTSANLATVAGAAATLKTSRWSILRMVESGRLRPVQKLPGRTGAYLFDSADVEALAAERRAS